MWFDSWSAVGQVLLVAGPTYVLLVTLLRAYGKRAVSKLNAFDLVVTVAMGSMLSSVLLSRDVSFAQGAAGFVALMALQYLVARLSLSSTRFARLVRAEPRLLLENGEFLEHALRSERVTRGEVLSALRSSGIGRIDEAGAVVLETDGSLSVLPAQHRPLDVLQDVKRR